MRRATEFRFSRLLLLVPLALSAGCAELLNGGGPSIGVAPVGGDYERGVASVRPRVEEDGFYVALKLDVEGYKGRQLPVQVWAGNVFLGEEIAEPTYDASIWKAFPVFVPKSRFIKIPKSADVVAYVIAPDNARTYIQKTTFNVTNPPPDQVWEFLGYREDVSLPTGERGFQLKAKLNVIRHKDEDIQVVLLLRDWARREFEPQEGGPIRLNVMSLRPRWEHTVWKELTLSVPYTALDRVGLGRTVVLTPSIRFSNDSLQAGNLHVRFYEGGSLTTLRERIGDEARNLNERIQYLQRQIEAIKKETAR